MTVTVTVTVTEVYHSISKTDKTQTQPASDSYMSIHAEHKNLYLPVRPSNRLKANRLRVKLARIPIPASPSDIIIIIIIIIIISLLY